MDTIIFAKSSRCSHIVKRLEKRRSESIGKLEYQLIENEEVISPELRVGVAENEKHSVSVLCSWGVIYIRIFKILNYVDV